MSSRAVALSVLLGGLTLLTVGADAGVETDPLSELVQELHHRRDDDLSGDLDKAGRKQLKAVNKSLNAIEKAGDDLKRCVKAGGKVAVVLGKAFPEEVGTPDLESHVFTLDNLIQNWLWELEREIEEELNVADAGRQLVDEKSAGKIDKQVVKADEALAAAEEPATFKDWGKALKKAAGAAVKAVKAAAKGGAPVGGDDGTSCTFGGGPFDAQVSLVETCRDGTGLMLTARDHERGSYDRVLTLWTGSVDGQGSYDLVSGGAFAKVEERLHGTNDEWRVFDAVVGSVDISTWDPPNLVEGNFTFTSTDGEVIRVVLAGEFRVSGAAIGEMSCD